MSDNITKGKKGEQTACVYLEQQGWQILSRNVKTPYGELDIIAQKDDLLVFFEVKYRTTSRFGYPEQAVTSQKARHLLASVAHYLQIHPEMGPDWRIDVIAIDAHVGHPIEIHWFENAISDIS